MKYGKLYKKDKISEHQILSNEKQTPKMIFVLSFSI